MVWHNHLLHKELSKNEMLFIWQASGYPDICQNKEHFPVLTVASQCFFPCTVLSSDIFAGFGKF